MSSLVAKRFLITGRLCRISGCLFIRDLRKTTTSLARVETKGLYTIYFVLCVLGVILFDAAFLLRRYFFSDIRQIFAKSVTLFFYLGLGTKVMVNFITILRGPSLLLAFLQESELFEGTTGTGFWIGKSFATRIPRIRLLGRFLIMVVCAAAFILGQRAVTAELVSILPSTWTALVIIGGCAGTALHYLYDSLTYLVLVPCCEVLGEYIRAQREVFHNRIESQKSLSNCLRCATIQDIRVNICRIKALKDMINDLWGRALLSTFGGVVFFFCLSIYALLDSNIPRNDFWAAVVYSVFVSLTALEIASVSQYMRNEVSLIRFSTTPITLSKM